MTILKESKEAYVAEFSLSLGDKGKWHNFIIFPKTWNKNKKKRKIYSSVDNLYSGD